MPAPAALVWWWVVVVADTSSCRQSTMGRVNTTTAILWVWVWVWVDGWMGGGDWFAVWDIYNSTLLRPTRPAVTASASGAPCSPTRSPTRHISRRLALSSAPIAAVFKPVQCRRPLQLKKSPLCVRDRWLQLHRADDKTPGPATAPTRLSL